MTIDPTAQPSDDSAAVYTHEDYLLHLRLQERIGQVFYESCSGVIRRTLLRCQWSFSLDNGELLLSITCPDRATYEQVNGLMPEIHLCLRELFCTAASVHLDWHRSTRGLSLGDRNSVGEYARNAQSVSLAMSIPLSEPMAYSEFETCKTLRIKHQEKEVVVVCLSGGDAIPDHVCDRDVAISVLSGEGVLDVDGVETPLVSGVLVQVPAHTFHSIRADEHLSMLCAWA